jgi:hypothetical protein
MIDDIKNLLKKKLISIFETTPSACMILSDTMGQWHLDDFEVVWFNASAKKLYGEIISHGKVHLSSNEQKKEVIENLQIIRQQLVLGREGFIGPFSSMIINSERQPTIVTRYTLYLGELGQSLPTFLVLAHHKIDE